MMGTRDGKQMMVVGVVSTGIGCARPFLPGLYTRVSEYIPWIRKTIHHWIGVFERQIRCQIFIYFLYFRRGSILVLYTKYTIYLYVKYYKVPNELNKLFANNNVPDILFFPCAIVERNVSERPLRPSTARRIFNKVHKLRAGLYCVQIIGNIISWGTIYGTMNKIFLKRGWEILYKGYWNKDDANTDILLRRTQNL